ncbi:ribosomal protein S18 acetylase RimI-like enzyme [Acinetobacter calcoaceticus]|uniref:Ribosomal protein S18 acetylase RimI-like enzyme n=1 Tax=Acinetobacter calcoaceticus TaxID=471 RepID=A0A4R1XAC4_ACICA|nr:ribosomal protein S18 acetylase RimI-like enzyme [Acinetobacter calcoaceticus]
MHTSAAALHIRNARDTDAPDICQLLQYMGYPQTAVHLIESNLQRFATDPQALTLVAEIEGQVCGFISMYLIPQMTCSGGYAHINFLCVDQHHRSKGIGEQLVLAAENFARMQGCERVELHSSLHRQAAHQFYLKLDYIESPKYFCKKLISNT